MSFSWFQKYWADKATPEFNTWWESYYGPLELYETDINNNEEAVDLYYQRKGCALMGWLAAKELKRNET